MVWVGLMAKLTDLGFLKGIFAETIVSTYNVDGTPNAAPMGIILENEQTLILNIFNTSTTNCNLKANKCAVINLTNNIEAFYKTTFKEANPNEKLPAEWFDKARTINAPRLQFADASIEVSVINMEPCGLERTKFVCSVKQTEAPKKYPQVYSRALSATIEAITHATRVKVFINDEKKQKQVSELLEMIENQKNLVNHVAPNSAYSAVMADLMKRIDSWRNKQ
jgi:hypothetical protein